MTPRPYQKQQLRARRRIRTRAKVHGTADRPRLSVFRSLKHISAQLIDDAAGVTLVSARDGDLPKTQKAPSPVERAHALGKLIADRAKEKNISRVVFDRGGRAYHGRIQALADGAREGGLTF
jgi:large subunit ribosomal protein L18